MPHKPVLIPYFRVQTLLWTSFRDTCVSEHNYVAGSGIIWSKNGNRTYFNGGKHCKNSALTIIASVQEEMFMFLHTIFRGSHCKLSLLDIEKAFWFHNLSRLTSQKFCLFLKINDNRYYSGWILRCIHYFIETSPLKSKGTQVREKHTYFVLQSILNF